MSDTKTHNKRSIRLRKGAIAKSLIGANGDAATKTGWIDASAGAGVAQNTMSIIGLITVAIIASVALSGWATGRTYTNRNLINDVNETLTADLDNVNTTLLAIIDDVNTTLSATIDDVNTSLTDAITTVNDTLTAEIENVNTTLCAKIMILDGKVDSEIEMLQAFANMTSEELMDFLMNATDQFTLLSNDVNVLQVDVTTLQDEITEIQDPSIFQRRVSGNCSDPTTGIRVIYEDGTVDCTIESNVTVPVTSVNSMIGDVLLGHADLVSGIGTNTHAQIDTHIADATIHRSIDDAGSGVDDLFSASKIISDLSGKADTVHTHTASQVTDFSTAADARIAAASIDALADVDTSTSAPIIGEALIWDGSDWVPGTAGTPVDLIALNDTVNMLVGQVETLETQVSALQMTVAEQQATIDEIIMNLTMVGTWPMEILDSGTAIVETDTSVASIDTTTWTLERVVIGNVAFDYLELAAWTGTPASDMNGEMFIEFTGLPAAGLSPSELPIVSAQFESQWPWLLTIGCVPNILNWENTGGTLRASITIFCATDGIPLLQTGTMRFSLGKVFV